MSFLFKAFGLAFLAARAPPRTRAPGSLHVGHEPQVSQPGFAGDALGLCCGLAGGAVAAISSRSRCRPKALVSKRGKCVRPAETSSKGTTKTVPKVLVVNLDRSPQRWESAQVEFAREGLQVERFSGTDGKALKPEELKKVATCQAAYRAYRISEIMMQHAEPKAKVKKPRPLPPPPPPALATAALLLRGVQPGPCGGELQPIWVTEPNCSKITMSLEGSTRDPFPKEARGREDGHAALLLALEKETNQLAQNGGSIAVFEMEKAEAEQRYGEAIYEPKSQRAERLRLAHLPGALLVEIPNNWTLCSSTQDCGRIEFLAKEVEAGSKKKPDTMIMAKKKQIFVKFSVEKGEAAAAEMAGEAPPAEVGKLLADNSVRVSVVGVDVPDEAKESTIKAAASSEAKEQVEEKEMVVDPWSVKGKIDYEKLIRDFGSTKISKELLERMRKLTVGSGRVSDLHCWLRRNIFFSHRELDAICGLQEKGKPFYLYTGRGPSSAAMHLGHLLPFMFTQFLVGALRWLQKAFNVPLVIQMTDDEKFLWKGEYDPEKGDNLHVYQRYTIENAKDIIACGFDKSKTFIFSDCDYVGHMYPNIVRVWKAITYNTAKGAFGFQGESNIGQSAFPAIQAVPSFPSSFSVPFKGDQHLPCLIPCAIDQDPYFRVTRDIAHKLVPKDHPLKGKPSLIHCKFFPPLTGAEGKMAASDENSAIFLTDTPEDIEKKINNYAFSGGRQTAKEQREKGADLDADVSYQWLRFFLDDDVELKKIEEQYGSGQGEDYWSTGQVKKKLIEVLKDLVKRHQEIRAKITDEEVQEWMKHSEQLHRFVQCHMCHVWWGALWCVQLFAMLMGCSWLLTTLQYWTAATSTQSQEHNVLLMLRSGHGGWQGKPQGLARLCTKGMIGCFLSHRRIWQKMVSEKLPAVVVLEDDVRLVEGFSDKLLKLMDELPADWEVCLLGAIGNINPDVEPFHMKLYSFCVGGGRPSPGKTRRVSDNVFVPHRPAGTHAYLVSLKGAERLVKELPLACYHVDLTAWSLPNLKLYAAVNQIATQDFEAASTASGYFDGVLEVSFGASLCFLQPGRIGTRKAGDTLGTVYIVTSSTLISFNKYLMQPGRFSHAVHLTAFHMVVTLVLSLAFYKVAPQFYPSMAMAKANICQVAKWIAPNQAYKYSSVAFLQFCKQGNVALMFFMSCAVGSQSFSWQKLAVLTVVIAGCTTCAHGEIHFVMIGLVLQLASQLTECSKNLIGEAVMGSAGLKLDVLTFVLFQAPFSLLFLSVGVCFSWTPEVVTDFRKHWHWLMVNACIAFLLNVLIAVTLKKLSALAFVIIGVVKDMVIVSSSSLVFGDPISQAQQVGFAVTITGVLLWSRLKLQEQAARRDPERLPLAKQDVKVK
ncbi:unnamed protein product [Cladocopium goreaui]|uniref:tryptophan--tRNA ligase n=1 Tax=Cladocopium goreaui TaxID=2562237 RepID=A0A9P1GF90_9DINO|nr:unnamed protein product [Cladocopium goreaui]